MAEKYLDDLDNYFQIRKHLKSHGTTILFKCLHDHFINKKAKSIVSGQLRFMLCIMCRQVAYDYLESFRALNLLEKVRKDRRLS